METSGGYGGTITPTGNSSSASSTMGVHAPFILDVTEVAGSLGFEPTRDQLKNLGSWVSNRNASKPITFSIGSNSTKLDYNECYFQSIALTASENSLLTATVDMWMYQTNFAPDGYLGGPTSREAVGTPVTDLIPYWATSVTGLPNGDVMSWSLTISQQLSKKFYCRGSDTSIITAPLPGNIYVGPLGAELTVDLLLTDEEINITDLLMQGTSSNVITVSLAGEMTPTNSNPAPIPILTMSRFVLTSLTPTFGDKGGPSSISLSYKAYNVGGSK